MNPKNKQASISGDGLLLRNWQNPPHFAVTSWPRCDPLVTGKEAHSCNEPALLSCQPQFWMTWTADVAGHTVQKVKKKRRLGSAWSDKHRRTFIQETGFCILLETKHCQSFLERNHVTVCFCLNQNFVAKVSQLETSHVNPATDKGSPLCVGTTRRARDHNGVMRRAEEENVPVCKSLRSLNYRRRGVPSVHGWSNDNFYKAARHMETGSEHCSVASTPPRTHPLAQSAGPMEQTYILFLVCHLLNSSYYEFSQASHPPRTPSCTI